MLSWKNEAPVSADHDMQETDATLEELHFRRIDMRAFKRRDGLLEVHGQVVDRKPDDFEAWTRHRVVPACEPIHDLGVRLVYDLQMTVQEVSTFTRAAPHAICKEGGQALQSLVGLRMTSGWNKEVRSRLSGERSCTHLMELLTPMATTAFQALANLRKDQIGRLGADGRPVKIDSCYAYGAEREVVMKYWPEFYRPPAPRSET